MMPQEQEIMAEEKRSSMRRAVPGSVAFVPSVAGLILAGEVIRDLAGDRRETLNEQLSVVTGEKNI